MRLVFQIILLVSLLFFGISLQSVKASDTSEKVNLGAGVWSLYVSESGVVFAGTLSNGLFRSEDNGQSFSETSLTGVTVYQITEAPSGLLFAAAQNGIYRSNDGGRTWRRVNDGIEKPIGQFVYAGESVQFAAIMQTGIYRSTDNGLNWTPVNNGIELPYGYTVTSHGDRIIAGATNRMYVSENNGDSWRRIEAGFGSSRSTDILVHGDVLFVGTQEGVFISEDAGDSWVEISHGLDNKIVYGLAQTENGVYAATRGGLYHLPTSGTQWNLVSDSDVIIYAIAADQQGNLYLGNNAGVWYWQP